MTDNYCSSPELKAPDRARTLTVDDTINQINLDKILKVKWIVDINYERVVTVRVEWFNGVVSRLRE